MEKFGEEEMVKGQVKIWQHIFNFIDSMALKTAVELRIADIINAHGHPITVSQIASKIESQSPPNIPHIERLMWLLVRRKILTVTTESESRELVYGLTPSSMWILHGAELSLAPMLLLQTDTPLMSSWHHLTSCIREGGIAFEKAHGTGVWDYGSGNPQFNRMFNDGMECATKIISRAIISGYKDGFNGIKNTLVDVGGGTGAMLAEIVKMHPHIKGINFDMPHVVATAQDQHHGVIHIGGDMFESVPEADAIFMKWILHDWSDEDCVKILKNCARALHGKKGKLIIAEGILDVGGKDLFDDVSLFFDLAMMAHTSGGKERSESQWKTLLEDGGFRRYKIIKIPAILSIIEAYEE